MSIKVTICCDRCKKIFVVDANYASDYKWHSPNNGILEELNNEWEHLCTECKKEFSEMKDNVHNLKIQFYTKTFKE
jgi:hypothetical protein